MTNIEILGMTLVATKSSEHAEQFCAYSHTFDDAYVYEAIDVYAYHLHPTADVWSLDIKRTVGHVGERMGETACGVSGERLADLADAWVKRASTEAPALCAAIVGRVAAKRAA